MNPFILSRTLGQARTIEDRLNALSQSVQKVRMNEQEVSSCPSRLSFSQSIRRNLALTTGYKAGNKIAMCEET
jgi:hypothetical protein